MDQFERIATLDNEVEAQLLDSLLAGQEIPHALQSFRDSAYDGMFQLQKGWGCVIGPVERRDEILEILADLRTQREVTAEGSAEDAPDFSD